MDKLKMHSMDMTQENIKKIREILPNCITESKDGNGKIRRSVDFDQLRQELSDHIVEGPQERYHLNWPGKRAALYSSNTPIAKTFRPERHESVNFDDTKNLFVEGDNLESLKLLQETYLGKIDMIFIDPPYNTGNDYVYNDKFSTSSQDYMRESNQQKDTGEKLIANPESNGRFHSDWLSMMYPRIKLARNLLSDDGAIFITIDDGEAHSLKKICDELFGEENFVANIIWQKKFARANDATYFSTMHDHILCYAKKSKLSDTSGGYWEMELLSRGEETPAGYGNPDGDPRGDWTSVVLSAKSGTEKLRYPITTPSGRVCWPPEGRYWGVSEARLDELRNDDRIWFGKNGDGTPRLKTFLSEVQDGLRPNTIWMHKEVGHNQEGRQEVKRLFDGKAYFDGPKPVRLLKTIISLFKKKEDFIALDFFAGSCTTGQAVLEKNAEDGGSRRFIMVQYPEPIDPALQAYKDGYHTVSSIGKDRLKRAGESILSSEYDTNWNKDVGFRALSVDTSNMAETYYTPGETYQEQLIPSVENIKAGRSDPWDLLFQVLTDWGVGLSLPITVKEVHGKTVLFVNTQPHDLIACFDHGITEELVKELAGYEPLRVVFRDNGFESDAVKINVEQIFKQLSPHTDVKSI